MSEPSKILGNEDHSHVYNKKPGRPGRKGSPEKYLQREGKMWE